MTPKLINLEAILDPLKYFNQWASTATLTKTFPTGSEEATTNSICRDPSESDILEQFIPEIRWEYRVMQYTDRISSKFN